jgi:hypothetical protein
MRHQDFDIRKGTTTAFLLGHTVDSIEFEIKVRQSIRSCISTCKPVIGASEWVHLGRQIIMFSQE